VSGFYTYFAVDGFTDGSTTANWAALEAWADEHELLFIPCVGPGYIDTRVRPWNERNTRSREEGAYYGMDFLEAQAMILINTRGRGGTFCFLLNSLSFRSIVWSSISTQRRSGEYGSYSCLHGLIMHCLSSSFLYILR
jgi:hypothetical protein